MDSSQRKQDKEPVTRVGRLRRIFRNPAIIIAGAVAIAVLLVFTRPERPTASRPEKAWAVDTQVIQLSSVRPMVEVYGRVQSPLDAALRAAIESDIVAVSVREGDKVENGQLLVQLDGRETELELIQRDAEAKDIEAQLRIERQRFRRNSEALEKEEELLKLSKGNALRAESILNDGLLSQSDVDQTAEAYKKQQLAVTSKKLNKEENDIRIAQLDAQFIRAKAIRDMSKLAVERTRILAPFSGVISNVEVSQGDRVRPGDNLIRMYNPESIEVRAEMPTRYASKVKRAIESGLDMAATVQFDGISAAANLERIAGQTRQGTGSVDAFLKFTKIPLGARLGATCKVLLSLPAEANSIELPAQAMYGRDRIYKVVDDRIQSVIVERLGERMRPDGRSSVVVRSDALRDGDIIVTTKISSAADGILVRATTNDSRTMNDAGTKYAGQRKAEAP